ncbi:hypothetical protein RJ639_035587 [Escallonia herrerae]|uniref:Phosphoglycerate mutase-like protein 1 n=1 Tax=Escallonia herrerae TaxID=1293975 RepID=A0AA88WP86_9ASTE|nr:hypothetical protein RJ639_035587 [Escallonia herrerae]
MDSHAGQAVYPLHRCKTIHLVRHAQGIHNVEGEKDHKAYLSPELFDAQLTPLGWQQVDNLRKHVHASGLSKKIELVIVSPLLRLIMYMLSTYQRPCKLTMQTAVGVFGGEGYSDGIDVPPLMVANAGNSSRPAISSLNCPPFVAVELCRECLIESDDDNLWNADVRERNEDLAARGMKFLNWLWTRKEKEIAVVTHSGYLIHTLNSFGNDCNPFLKSELGRPQALSICLGSYFSSIALKWFVQLVYSDFSTTDYPGKIPSGADVPSAAAK